MTDYPDYHKATNTAYMELEKYDGSFPRIDIFRIIRQDRNIALITYTEASEKLGCSHNEFAYNIAPSEQGFTIKESSSSRSIIFYNNLKDSKTIRFTMAHELGHIRLKHENDDKISDKEANCFARNILCPCQFAVGFHLSTAKEYSDWYGISMPMAEAAIGNFKHDIWNIDENLYNEIRDKIDCYMFGISRTDLYGFSEPQYYY